MRLAFLAVAALLLAGCASSPVPGTGTTVVTATQTGALNKTVAPRIVAVTSHLNETGNLGVSFGGCVFPLDQCHFPDPPVAGVTDFMFNVAPGNLTAFEATLTWQTSTPHTAKLAIGAMVMNECEGCNQTFLGEVEGTSPLTWSQSGIAAPLGPGQVVHFYVYNPSGGISNPNVPGFAYATTDQEFAFAGRITVAQRA